MTGNTLLQIALTLGVMVALVKPLGAFMARVYQRQPCGADRVFGWLVRLIYRVAGINPLRESGWKAYAAGVLLFNLLGMVVLYALQRTQHLLPLNPQQFPPGRGR